MSSASVTKTFGSYTNTLIRKVFYGPQCLESALPEAMALLSANKRAVIITGNSLATKTDVVSRVERALGDSHAGTYSSIGQHAPVAEIRSIIEALKKNKADVLVAVGGGSPVDSAKAISYYLHEQEQQQQSGEYLPIIAIPTTLSVAETTQNAGFTSDEGKKTGVSNPALVPRVIIYDAELTKSTPDRLWLSSGMRAVDHAIELLYRSGDSTVLQGIASAAIRELFYLLPASKQDPSNIDVRQRLQLACFNSLWPESRLGALGLSHGLGHALGATYAIPHGITSCLTLPGAIAITSQTPTTSVNHLLALSDALNFIPPSFYAVDGEGGAAPAAQGTPPPSVLVQQTGAQLEQTVRQARARGLLVSQAVRRLIETLGLHSTLSEYKVPKQDFETIAQHVTRGKDATLQQLIVAMLHEKYEDTPERL